VPWKYNNKTIREGQSWTDASGVKHPTNWGIWTDAQKTAAGMTWENPPASFNSDFYWDANTAKNIADVNETDDDGNAILDDNGNQLVTKGLKSVWKERTKETAAALLSQSDWYIIRKQEDSTATIPSAISTYRTAVRTASNTIETAIDNAADHAAFMALFDVPTDDNGDPTGNAPINDWPDEV
jgi:hypothetical protein